MISLFSIFSAFTSGLGITTWEARLYLSGILDRFKVPKVADYELLISKSGIEYRELSFREVADSSTICKILVGWGFKELAIFMSL